MTLIVNCVFAMQDKRIAFRVHMKHVRSRSFHFLNYNGTLCKHHLELISVFGKTAPSSHLCYQVGFSLPPLE